MDVMLANVQSVMARDCRLAELDSRADCLATDSVKFSSASMDCKKVRIFKSSLSNFKMRLRLSPFNAVRYPTPSSRPSPALPTRPPASSEARARRRTPSMKAIAKKLRKKVRAMTS